MKNKFVSVKKQNIATFEAPEITAKSLPFNINNQPGNSLTPLYLTPQNRYLKSTLMSLNLSDWQVGTPKLNLCPSLHGTSVA